METGGDIDVAVRGECESLGAAESAIPRASFTMGIDGPDRVIRRERGAGDKKRTYGVDCEVVGGDAGLKRGVNEDLAVAVDFEDGSTAIADEEIALRIEDSASGDAHAFGVKS